jgi:hypothetical protein
MQRLTTAFATIFLLGSVCLTASADEKPPAWAIKAFNEKVGTRYEVARKLEPFFYVGDFNGDTKSDVALFIKEKSTGKLGIAIVEDTVKKFKILGAGKSFGNGGDDFSWVDAWSIRHSGKVDRLYVAKSEAASGVIYWEASEYKWQQEAD